MNVIFETVEASIDEAVIAGSVMDSVANSLSETLSETLSDTINESLAESMSPLTSSESEAAKDDTFARYHSLLAMEAARKMRRTRQKRKTGQEICHHLKMMLAEPVPERNVRSRSQFQLGF